MQLKENINIYNVDSRSYSEQIKKEQQQQQQHESAVRKINKIKIQNLNQEKEFFFC